MEIFFVKVSWNLTVFENFQCSDWLIQWSHDLKWDFERFQAYLKLLEVMDPYRTLFDSWFETFLISKVSNSTSHLKSHLKVSNKQQMRLETRFAISALHKANWLPCWTWIHVQVRINRALLYIYKDPKVSVLQTNTQLAQKGQCWTWNQRLTRGQGSIPNRGNSTTLIYTILPDLTE